MMAKALSLKQIIRTLELGISYPHQATNPKTIIEFVRRKNMASLTAEVITNL